MDILKISQNFELSKKNFINDSHDVVNYIHKKLKFVTGDELSPFGGRRWSFKEERMGSKCFILDVYANGQVVSYLGIQHSTIHDDLIVHKSFYLQDKEIIKLLDNMINDVKEYFSK